MEGLPPKRRAGAKPSMRFADVRRAPTCFAMPDDVIREDEENPFREEVERRVGRISPALSRIMLRARTHALRQQCISGIDAHMAPGLLERDLIPKQEDPDVVMRAREEAGQERLFPRE